MRRRKFKKVPEADVQKAIFNWLEVNGYYAKRFPVGPVLHQRGGKVVWKKNPLKGFPDIMAIMKNRTGVTFWIEVKSTEGRVEDHQREVHEDLRAWGVLVIEARNIFDVADALRVHDVRETT